jgi:predicted PurR-regulated permease PerM
MTKIKEVPTRQQAKLERAAFLLFLILVTCLFLVLLKPFFDAIFWACIIALIFHPVQERLLKLWGKKRRNLSAITALLICVVIGIIPLAFILGLLIEEGAMLYQLLHTGQIDFSKYITAVKEIVPATQRFLEHWNLDLEAIKAQLSQAALTLSRYIARNSLELGQGTVKFAISFGLMLYLAFFLLRDGSKLVDLIARALPLGRGREELLFDKFVGVTRATIKGTLVVAIVQGTLGGLIFGILGLPAPVLWGAVMAILSLVPVVGASLVWVPAAIYLFMIGAWVKALVLIGFSAGIISLVEHILRPILVRKGTKLPDCVVLLTTLGGFALFGFTGFVMGPLLAALFVAFWGIFMREFKK